MSELIDVKIAFGIVKECCESSNMPHKVVDAIDNFILQIQLAFPFLPSEAGVLPPGLLPGIVSVAKGATVGIKGKVQYIALKTPVPDKLTVPVPEIVRYFKTLRDVQQQLRAMDFCTGMLGCVAKGFREHKLYQGRGPRELFYNAGVVKHFMKAGSTSSVPAKAKRHVRK